MDFKFPLAENQTDFCDAFEKVEKEKGKEEIKENSNMQTQLS